MVVLATTLTLAAVISSSVSVHLLTILQASGVSLAAAVGLGALVGPSQVAARTVEMTIARYHHPIWTKIASVSFVAAELPALWANLAAIPVALGFYGAGIRLKSIARGTLPLAPFGASGYAALIGRLALPAFYAQAAAPWLGAILLAHVGSHGTLGVLASVALLNVTLAAGLSWIVYRQPLDQPRAS